VPIFCVGREIIGSLLRPPSELPSFERNELREQKIFFLLSLGKQKVLTQGDYPNLVG
jgi:hypothetical protein